MPIESVEPHGQDGYTIKYKEGDLCNVKNDVKFSAEVRYVCDPKADVGKPAMLPFEGNLTHALTKKDCHYAFEHRSKYACSQCRADQVSYVRSTCSNGLRDVHILAKTRSEKCIVVDREFLLADGTTQLKELKGSTGFVFGEESFTEQCDVMEAAMENVFFVRLLQLFGLIFGCVCLCSCCTGCSYSQMSRNLDRLKRYRESQMRWVARRDGIDEENRVNIGDAVKGVEKFAKDMRVAMKKGASSVGKVVQAKLKGKKPPQQAQQVEMEDFEVEIGNDEL